MESEMRSSGVVTDDPLKAMPIGATISFGNVGFSAADATTIPQGVTNWTIFEGALLAICIARGDEKEVIGTAAIVAPGLAVTATHVLNDEIHAIMDGKASLICFGPTSSGLQMWNVRKYSACEHSDDISFLSLEMASAMPEGVPLRKFALSARAPTIGETLHVVGFQMPEVRPHSPAEKVALDAIGTLYIAAGQVTEFFPTGRDDLLLPYPSMEIACGTHCGMSGGAVLDSQGLLVGVISRGWDHADGEGPSYAAWIVGALNRKVEVTWPPGAYAQAVELLEIHPDWLRIEGRQHVRIGGELPSEAHLVVGNRIALKASGAPE